MFFCIYDSIYILSFVWGYSLVEEHSTADRKVPGSNPGVPCFNQIDTACQSPRIDRLSLYEEYTTSAKEQISKHQNAFYSTTSSSL